MATDLDPNSPMGLGLEMMRRLRPMIRPKYDEIQPLDADNIIEGYSWWCCVVPLGLKQTNEMMTAAAKQLAAKANEYAYFHDPDLNGPHVHVMRDLTNNAALRVAVDPSSEDPKQLVAAFTIMGNVNARTPDQKLLQMPVSTKVQ